MFLDYHLDTNDITNSKFFGTNPNARPAVPQQAKLAFSTKSSQEKSKKTDPAPIEEDTAAQSSATAIKSEVKEEAEPSTPRKRAAKDHEDEVDSDDEPPVKRQRKSTANGSKVKKEESEDDDLPAAKSVKAPSKSATTAKQAPTSAKSPKKEKLSAPVKVEKKKKIIKEEDEDMDDDADVAPPPKRVKKADQPPPKAASPKSSPPAPAKAEDDSVDSDQSADEHSGSDSELEEKPEIVAKAREKVRSTLKTSGQDPYPDWKAGDPVPYAALCTTFSKIEMTTKRLEISAHCSLFLRQVLRLTPGDLLPTVLLMINKLAADYSGIELGIGESLIMKAIGESTGRALKDIKADQHSIGDLGLVAAKSRSNQPTMFKPKPLTVQAVHKGLLDIATVEGQGAQGRKVGGIKKLLSSADAASAGKGSKGVDITKDKGGPSEAKFIVRTLEGKLRLGLADKTVLVALAQAMTVHEVSQKGNKVPSTEQLAKGEQILKSVYR